MQGLSAAFQPVSVDTSVKDIASFTLTGHDQFKVDVTVSVPHPQRPNLVQRFCENGNMIVLGVENSPPGEESIHIALHLSPFRRHLGSSRALPTFDTKSSVDTFQ